MRRPSAVGGLPLVAVGLWSLACGGREYTRCEACFADDRGECIDLRELESLGQSDPDDARCHASLELCSGVTSRCLQGGECDRRHRRQCDDPPVPFRCDADWLQPFTFTCEAQRVGAMVPF
jgi:hypothetical protein